MNNPTPEEIAADNRRTFLVIIAVVAVGILLNFWSMEQGRPARIAAGKAEQAFRENCEKVGYIIRERGSDRLTCVKADVLGRYSPQ